MIQIRKWYKKNLQKILQIVKDESEENTRVTLILHITIVQKGYTQTKP